MEDFTRITILKPGIPDSFFPSSYCDAGGSHAAMMKYAALAPSSVSAREFGGKLQNWCSTLMTKGLMELIGLLV